MGATVRTLGLFGLLTLLMAAVGWIAGGIFAGGNPLAGTLLFLAIAGVLNFVSYFWGHKLVLKAHRAEMVDRDQAPRLHRIVEEQARNASLPKPQVAVVPSRTPNAFATGRDPDHAVVAATQGLLQLLDDDELAGVMAHELAHVRNRDTLVMSVAATLAGAITFIGRSAIWSLFLGGGRDGDNLLSMVLLAVLAPMAALLVRAAISRNREHKADATGGGICGRPEALASALRKLERGNEAQPMRGGNPAHSHLYIAAPLTGGFGRLFRTHPPMDDRVERLHAQAREMGRIF